MLENIKELEENIERKEHFLQIREKKWIEVEKILEFFAIDDDDLKDRLAELRIYVLPASKISNVVTKNDELLNDLAKAYREIDRMRSLFLDPFARKKTKYKAANDNMADKLEAIIPKSVEISAN